MNPSVIFVFTTILFDFIDQASSIRCLGISVRYGKVKYRSRGRVAIFACWGGFSLYGEKYAGCFRGAWDVSPPKCVRRGCSDVDLEFGSVKKPLYSTAVLSFRCYSGYTLMGPKEIYCDGSTYDNTPPTCKREETDISCDFENQGLCKWRNDPTANLTFHLQQQAAPSRVLNTGPDHDHTLDPQTDGYYLYLESSSTSPGDAARLYSPYLPHATGDNMCFKFWYHMYGSTIGALRVYINETIAFERTGNRGNRWRLGKVKLPTNGHFKIVIEAVAGKGYTGDIAIDDLDVGDCVDDSGSTCIDRCSEDENDEFSTCDCHPGCADESSCCADFNHYCIAETPDFAESTTTSELTVAFDETTTDLSIQFENTEMSTILDDSIEEISSQTDDFTTHDYSDVPIKNDMINIDSTTAESPKENTFDFLNISRHTTHIKNDMLDSEETTEEMTVTHFTKSDFYPTTISNTSKRTNTSWIKPITHGYNLRPRTKTTIVTVPTSTSTKPTSTTTNKATPSPKSIISSKLTTSISVKPIVTPKLQKSTEFKPVKTSTTSKPTIRTTITKSSNYTSTTTKKPLIPILHQPITHPTVKIITKRFSKTTLPTKFVTISMKDPKITTHLVTKTATENIKSGHVSTDYSINHITATDLKTPSYIDITDIPSPISGNKNNTSKWKSKYKAKGAYQLIEEERFETAGFEVWPEVIAVLLTLSVLALSSIALIWYIRKRRLTSSGSTEEADILYTPSDEMLDFSPYSGGTNRDSGVYSETVTTLKREI